MSFDIYIDCGADFVLTLTLRDEDGNLVDLTGATVSAQMRENPEANDHFDFTVTHNDDGGKILMRMPPETTEKIPFTEGVYDLFLTLSGEVMKVIDGKANIKPSATH